MDFEKVRAIIAKQLDIDPETITPSSSLIDDLHADSLDIVELVMDMEQEFDVEIPDEVYKSGKTYSVLRVHNGQLSVLPDLDDDPKTITFRTDRFSTYAIAKQVTSANNLVTWLVAGAALAFGVAMTCFLILIAHQRKYVKARKHAHK